MNRPRFAIVNEVDAPCRRMLAEWVNGIGYCYMARSSNRLLKRFDGMKPSRPTPIENFGFDVEIEGSIAKFAKIRKSSATYEDGEPRQWQDTAEAFEYPLVVNVKATRKRAA